MARGKKGRFIFSIGHIPASKARKWIRKLRQDSGQEVFSKKGRGGTLEIWTAGDWAYVLFSIHKFIEDYEELWQRENTHPGTLEAPPPPVLENPKLLRELALYRKKTCVAQTI